MNSDRLHRRLRQIHARAAIRRWEVRQVRHAHGVWFRLEQLLAGTRCALAISSEKVLILRMSGFEPHPIGAELEPPKSLFVVPEERLPSSIEGADVPLQDKQQILLAPALVLIPFR